MNYGQPMPPANYALMQQRPQMPQQPPQGPGMGAPGMGAPGMAGPGMQVPPGMQPPPGGAAPGAGGVPPGLANQVLSGYGQGDERLMIQRQRKIADMLRQNASDQLQGAGMVSGRYVGPNLANLASSIYGSYKAGQMDEGSDTRATGLGTAEQDAMRAWFKRMAGGQQG